MEIEKQTSTTFSELINEKINEGMPGANRTIVNSLVARNIRISMRSIQSYRKGERVPPFLTAKEILKILRVEVDDDELIRILNASRRNGDEDLGEKNYNSFERKDEKQSNARINVNISVEDLDIAADSDMKTEILNDRLMTLYGDEASLNRYIKQLIEYDLENEILEGEE